MAAVAVPICLTLLRCSLPWWCIRCIVGSFSSQSEGKTYAELCAKDLDGVTCELPFRGVTRFWNNDFVTYEVRYVCRVRCV